MLTDMKEKANGKKAAEAELDLYAEETAAEVSAEVLEKAAYFKENYMSSLKERTEAYVQRMADLKAQGPGAELGGPIDEVDSYQYWNLLTTGPIQFFGPPPYRPSRIIAAGEWTLITGVVWVNPAPNWSGLPGTVVLGGRNYRVRFETINLTNVSNGPDKTYVGVFPPVPGIHFFDWWFLPSDPGVNPNLYQTYMTADITNMAQPFAAFSTWHFDPDVEPGFLGLPTQFGGWEHERPCQYLVYRK